MLTHTFGLILINQLKIIIRDYDHVFLSFSSFISFYHLFLPIFIILITFDNNSCPFLCIYSLFQQTSLFMQEQVKNVVLIHH